MARKKVKVKAFTVNFDKADIDTMNWLDNQLQISTSIRMLIKSAITLDGFDDLLSSDGSGVLKKSVRIGRIDPDTESVDIIEPSGVRVQKKAKKFRVITFRVPVTDVDVIKWLECQNQKSTSIRLLVKTSVAIDGMVDVMSSTGDGNGLNSVRCYRDLDFVNNSVNMDKTKNGSNLLINI